MANTAITTIAAGINASTVSTATAATVDTINGAEIFDITPVRDSGFYFEIANVSAANGTVTWSLAIGDYYAAPAAALTGSVAQGVSAIIVPESAKYKQSDGTYTLTITPASGKKLKTDHTLTVKAVNLPKG